MLRMFFKKATVNNNVDKHEKKLTNSFIYFFIFATIWRCQRRWIATSQRRSKSVVVSTGKRM